AALFPFLYRWMGAPPTTFAAAHPAARELELSEWINTYRAGDYVGRSIWTAPTEETMFRVATVTPTGDVVASRCDDRTQLCIGGGAHTHYFSNDAIALAIEIDRLVGGDARVQQDIAQEAT